MATTSTAAGYHDSPRSAMNDVDEDYDDDDMLLRGPRDKQARRNSSLPTMREILTYLIFLSLFTAVLYLTQNSEESYYLSESIKDLFLFEEYGPDQAHILKSFYDVRSYEEMWQWFKGPFMGGMYPSEWYNGEELSEDEQGYLYGYDKVIGVARIRQIRVAASTCTATPLPLQSSVTTCYPEYTDITEDRTAFGPNNQYTWSDHDGFEFHGRLRGYPSSGFVVDLSRNATQTLAILSDLEEHRFVDLQTRAVIVDFTVYNGNINRFGIVRVLFETPASGGVLPFANVRMQRMYRYETVSDYIVAALELTLAMFVMWYLHEELSEMARNRFKYIRQVWNYVDLLNLFIFCMVIVIRVYTTVQLASMVFDADAETFVDFNSIGYLMDQERNILATNIFLCWFKVFKYLQVYPRMNQLSQTLALAFSDILTFFMMFFIIFFGFAQAGFMIFGADVAEFRTISHSMSSLFRATLGDFDFDGMYNANRFLGPMFFIAYMGLVFFVMLNMFLAIINDSYSEVKSSVPNESILDECRRFIATRLRDIEAALRERQENVEKFAGELQAGDKDGDGKLNARELERMMGMDTRLTQAMKKLGGSGGSAKKLLEKYDKDGDHLLDQQEQSNLLRDLERTAAEAACPGVLVAGIDYDGTKLGVDAGVAKIKTVRSPDGSSSAAANKRETALTSPEPEADRISALGGYSAARGRTRRRESRPSSPHHAGIQELAQRMDNIELLLIKLTAKLDV